jgi:hypothetical protein
MKPSENVKGKIRVLTLKRETLRELDAKELKQAQGGARRTELCSTERNCGPKTKHCDTNRACVHA